MEGSPYRKFSISRRKGSDPETEPRKLHSGEPGFLPAGILGTGVPFSGDPEAGGLPGVWRYSIPVSLTSDRGLVLFGPPIFIEDGEHWASDDVLETVEPIFTIVPSWPQPIPSADSLLRKINPEPLSFLFSFVGGRARPCHPFTDLFSSPVPSWWNVPEADSEAVPMAPLRRIVSCFFDDGPRSKIREGDLAKIRRMYLIHPSVGMRSQPEFKHAPDGGAGEVAVYEAYLEAGFRGAIPSLIGEVSSFFGFSPSQLTPLTWRTLMALQVLGELHGFSIGEPSRGVRGNRPFGDGWNSRYVFVKIQEPVGYPMFSRTVDVSRPVSFAGEAVAKLIMGIPWRLRWVTFLVSGEALRHSRVLGNAVSSPVSVIYDEYQKVKARKRHLSYTPPLRLARAASSAGGLSSISSTSAKIMPNWDLLTDAHRRLTSEALLLRGQVQDMMACRDLLIQQVRASARWELMREWLEKRIVHWNREEEYRRHMFLSVGFNRQSENLTQAATPRSDLGINGEGGARAPLGSLDCVWDPEEPGGSSLDPEIFDWNPEAIGEPRGTVLRLPRQDYYRKSLTGLKGAGVGVVTQVPGLRCFPPRKFLIHVLFTLVLWGPRCALGYTGALGSFDSILRLAHTHSCFMSHTRFDSLWECHCGRTTFVRVGHDQRSLET
ncbi:hypothetical protein DY000_02014915 [Brassica cretica]|uniref:Uncharacterized protein n=1 Tax=Brassica cretica TaxID=69181 RepID=A0ABQ7CQ14_BRACR|nr:hypothetical protein DY000_02014915 [Brassica cretica]